MKRVCMSLVVFALAFAASAESWDIGAAGAKITATLENGRLTLLGNGATQDFESAATTPWAGKTILDVAFNGDITPGKNLLSGLGDEVTINGSMKISTLRQLSEAFLAGEVSPAEAGEFSLGSDKVVMTVDIASCAAEASWTEATVESVKVVESGEVELTIPVGASEGVYRLRAVTKDEMKR